MSENESEGEVEKEKGRSTALPSRVDHYYFSSSSSSFSITSMHTDAK